MSAWASLLAADARNIAREPPLWACVLLPWLLALGLRFGFASLEELTAPWIALGELRPHVAAFAVVMPGMMIGWVVGFLLLDERDDGVLAAIEVTPLGRGGFTRYRLLLPTLLTLVTAALVHLCAGVLAPGWGPTLTAIVAASAVAPLVALFLVGFAGNKVEGLALAKLASLLVLLPGWWTMRMFTGGLDPRSLAELAVGLSLAALAGAWLLRRVDRQIER